MPLRFKEHQQLLIQRERRVVLGKRAVNLWLLVLVLTLTFLSIAFSEGSLAYLNDKMNDPFTNWVNINRGSSDSQFMTIRQLQDSLLEKDKREYYQYDNVQTEIWASINLFTSKQQSLIFSILYYEDMSNDLIHAVLDPDNIVNEACIPLDEMVEDPIGLILSEDALRRLRYDAKHIPPYVDYSKPYEGGDSLGYEMIQDYVRVPLPVLAVVKRLPMNKEIIASKRLYKYYQDDNSDGPFNMEYEGGYIKDPLHFFVPAYVTDFEEIATRFIPDSLRGSKPIQETEESTQELLRGWMKGTFYNIYTRDRSTPREALFDIAQRIRNHYAGTDVTQVYDYRSEAKPLSSNLEDIISIHFTRLDLIGSFRDYVKDISGLEIEMSQVQSRENFNAISRLANILTIAMIIFAITCIVIFIANMLQSYFQKVRRNLGTFKAFGISTRELTRVYIIIIMGIVSMALVIALAVTGFTELILHNSGCLKDGEYDWLLLCNAKTLWAVVIIVAATIATVIFVMHRLLRQTPGDLIYDR